MVKVKPNSLLSEDEVYKLVEDGRFYVYLIAHPVSRKLIYIGKGRGFRFLRHWYDNATPNNKHKHRSLNQIRDIGLKPLYCIRKFDSEDSAYKYEATLIGKYFESITNIKRGEIKYTKSEYKESFISKSKKKHGDKYDYSKVIYLGSSPVEIICKEHGSFWQRPYNHIKKGEGCMKCSGKYLRDLSWFLQEAYLYHGDTYLYGNSVYSGYHKPITVTCKKHGDFEIVAGNHIIGQGCSKCGRERTVQASVASRIKPIVMLELNTGKFIKKFESITSTVEQGYANHRNNVGAVCMGKTKSAYGYDWWYLEDYIKYLKKNKREIPKELL